MAKIDNPIINSPYFEPSRHFKFDKNGITENIVEERRPSSFFTPIARPTNRDKQIDFSQIDTTWTDETIVLNDFVNKIRTRIAEWRKNEYPNTTKVTKQLLDYWTDPERANKLFFCQIEALETFIYINEVAEKLGDAWIINELKRISDETNPGLIRVALKMATGSGKTVLMAMIIAYEVLNKVKYPRDVRFVDTFLVVAPGITIKDRLKVLLPQDSENYYKKRDLVPNTLFDDLFQASSRIIITNFHNLELKKIERYQGSRVVKEEASKESSASMVNRVLRNVKNAKSIIVINDEAHHCYKQNPQEIIKLTGDERKEADENNEYARVWLTGLEHVNSRINIKCVVDLSATPSFLKGSGYPEGKLFPWVISDFSLIDAIECGIVKVPRVPVRADNISDDNIPDYRNLWLKIRDELPKQGARRAAGSYSVDPKLPTLLETALRTLYENYKKYYVKYEETVTQNPKVMPPVMIVVCNNTSVSKMVYDWIAGYEKQIGDKTVFVPGNLPIFRNYEEQQKILKPNTLVIDSAQLESGEAIDDNFRKNFSQEIEDFQKEYAKRFPGRELPTDSEILREVMNTVGKKGKLGENIKCVVSVSMLTEGWDTNTVTHILGIRAFSTQLLCEQVVGRGLRRISYEPDTNGFFTPEYAEVYGVPFSFYINADGPINPQPPKEITRVRALEERENQYEIRFPRVEGYRYEIDEQKLTASFSEDVRTIVENIPTKVDVAPIVGEEATHEMEELKNFRKQQVIYYIASNLLRTYFSDKDGSPKFWLFPQIKNITEEYVNKHVKLKDNMFYGLLLLTSYMDDVTTKINSGIIKSQAEKKIMPILAYYDPISSTRYVDFLTTKPTQETVKSHVNYVVADTEEWEQGVAKKLEDMKEVISYVKNQGLDFTIPYQYGGVTRSYVPDFIVKLKHPTFRDPINLLIEVTGKKDDKKSVKVDTAQRLWIPAVNNHGDFGLWEFIEIQDIHETQNLIRYKLNQTK
jgi:type III restriction enzyme